MTETPAIIIVVPFNGWNEWVLECVAHCDALDIEPGSAAIWLLPDSPPPPNFESRLRAFSHCAIHIEPTGPGNPAFKRNVALRKCRPRAFALVDSDAYPRKDWLRNALPLLTDNVGIVAGPNLTPPGDPLLRRVCGRIMESPLGFGMAYVRHTPVARHTAQEMPTCNMILRPMEGMLFREDLDTGEDMMYCADVRARGFSVLYDPEIVVYHHRRTLFRPFFEQFYHYGYNKGELARSGSDVTYVWQAAPAGLVGYLFLAAVLSLLIPPMPAWLRWLLLSPLLLYGVGVFFETLRRCRTPGEIFVTPAGFLVAHLGYGLGYLQGLLLSRSLPGNQPPPQQK